MYSLEQTSFLIKNFYDEMLEGRHDNSQNNYLKTRLESIKPILIDEEMNYKQYADKGNLHQIPKKESISIPTGTRLHKTIPELVTSKDMKKVYSNYFVGKKDSTNKGREVYDAIMANTYFNLCPYCSHRDVKTVDHYLPKSTYISFSIIPANLLPCCSDCNKDKGDDIQSTKDRMLIHPYFDKVDHLDWLKCKVVEQEWPITFKYRISDDIEDYILKSRMDNQFNLLNLDILYADNATREFNKRVKILVNEYNSNPENKALHLIERNIETYKSENQNSWQTKMYEALKESEWFQNEALPNLEEEYINKRL